jgi:hypothetical protein
MRFASRLTRHAGIAARGTFLVALGVVALGFASGCNDDHIGRPCITNSPDAGASGGQVTVISSPVLQCPSRICIDPGDQKGVATMHNEGPFCTAGCSTDDDCSNPDPGTQCTGPFYCMWPTTSGPFACDKLCVCSDFVVRPQGGFTKPASCN